MKTKQFNILSALILLKLIFLSGLLHAQVMQQWAAEFNGSGNCTSQAIGTAVDAAGNVYVTGSTCMGFTTIKYNSAGAEQWIANCTQGYNASAIAVDGAGNVYVTGWGDASGGTAEHYITVKYNNAGVQQWIASFIGPANYFDRAYGIAVDPAGNVYITGGGSWAVGVGFDFATIKYNPAGQQQWVARFDGPGGRDDGARAIKVDAAGNVYVTGYCFTGGADYDYATIKYNTSGVQQWVQRYTSSGSGTDEAFAIVLDASGNVYVTGKSMGTHYEYATVKYNNSGAQQWAERYSAPGNNWNEAWAIAVDATGNVYVTGGGYGSGTNIDYATVKYNTGGIQQWAQTYNGPGNNIDFAEGIAVDGTGNVYVTGQSSGSGSDRQYATIKYNSSGTQQWIQRFGTPGQINIATSIALDANNNVYVTGGESSYFTVKYSQVTGITPVSNEIPKSFELMQNYPNPFNPSTNFEFRIADFGNVQLKIYDILGNEAATALNEELQAGTYKVEFNAASLPSGTYFYRLTAGSSTETKKMILLK